jgi:hypothetical protein
VVAALDALEMHLEMHYEEPVEKLWKKIKQPDTHLHYFPTFEVPTEKVEQALLKLANAPEEVFALCGLPIELAQAASARFLKNLFLECYISRQCLPWHHLKLVKERETCGVASQG